MSHQKKIIHVYKRTWATLFILRIVDVFQKSLFRTCHNVVCICVAINIQHIHRTVHHMQRFLFVSDQLLNMCIEVWWLLISHDLPNHQQYVSCLGKDMCKDATLSCRPNDSCTIHCTGAAACSGSTVINGSSATDVTLICDETDACKGAHVLCGTGSCMVVCTQSDGVCEDLTVDIASAASYHCINCVSSTSNNTVTPSPINEIPDSMFVGERLMNFSDANAYCTALDRHLISIHSYADQWSAAALCELVELINNTGGCWIGLSDQGTNEWAWADGTPLDYGFNQSTLQPLTGVYPWDSNEPNNINEKCVEMRPEQFGYEWNDGSCSTLRRVLCSGMFPW